MTIDTNRQIAEIINSKFRVIKKLQKYVVDTQQQIEDQMNKLENMIDDILYCKIHALDRDHTCEGCKRYQETGYMYECEHGPYDDRCKKCEQEDYEEENRDNIEITHSVFESIFGGHHA